MIQMQSGNGGTWHVAVDGKIVFTGTLWGAKNEYRRLITEQLNAKPQTRRGGKRIYR